MDKKVRVIVIAVACIAILCGGFFLFTQGLNAGNPDKLTEVQKIIVTDLEKNYPPSPRSVVELYNRIVHCYHSEGLKKDELSKLVDQMMLLWDKDLLVKNTKEEYLLSVQADIQLYKQAKKTIMSMSICDLDDVEYKTDDRNGDKLAFVDTTYFVNNNGEFTNSYMRVGLRKDDKGNWKIIGVTLKEVEKDEK